MNINLQLRHAHSQTRRAYFRYWEMDHLEMAQQSPLTTVKGGRTSRGSTGSARLVRPAWTQSRPSAQPVTAADVSVSQVDSTVDLSVPIILADLDGVVYPTNINFPDCLSIDINFNKSVIHSNSINNSNDTIEASSSFDMNIDTSFPVISTINNNNHSRYNYTLPHSKLICTGPFWRLPKYSLPPPIQLGPEHLASSPISRIYL